MIVYLTTVLLSGMVAQQHPSPDGPKSDLGASLRVSLSVEWSFLGLSGGARSGSDGDKVSQAPEDMGGLTWVADMYIPSPTIKLAWGSHRLDLGATYKVFNFDIFNTTIRFDGKRYIAGDEPASELELTWQFTNVDLSYGWALEGGWFEVEPFVGARYFESKIELNPHSASRGSGKTANEESYDLLPAVGLHGKLSAGAVSLVASFEAGQGFDSDRFRYVSGDVLLQWGNPSFTFGIGYIGSVRMRDGDFDFDVTMQGVVFRFTWTF